MIHVTWPMCDSNLLRRQVLPWSHILLLASDKIIFLRHSFRKIDNVFFACTANVSNSILHHFDTTLSIVGDYISSDVGLTVLSKDNDTVKCTLLDLVPPYQRHGPSLVIITNNLHTVLVRFWNRIIKQLWFVVLDFNSNATDLNLILHNVRINVQSDYDWWAFTESELVALNLGSWCLTLDEDSSCLATHDDILRNDDVIFRLWIYHDGSRIKVCEWALMNCCITLKWQHTSCERILQCVSLEVAMEYLKTRIWLRDDTWDLTMGLSRTAI